MKVPASLRFVLITWVRSSAGVGLAREEMDHWLGLLLDTGRNVSNQLNVPECG